MRGDCIKPRYAVYARRGFEFYRFRLQFVLFYFYLKERETDIRIWWTKFKILRQCLHFRIWSWVSIIRSQNETQTRGSIWNVLEYSALRASCTVIFSNLYRHLSICCAPQKFTGVYTSVRELVGYFMYY